MGITVPISVNYPSPLNAVPSLSGNTPREGQKLITVEIDWATMGGSQNSVFINLQNNATLEFSQICALSVDNSACGADILFVFPDTQETTQIPAYSPKTIVPVFTNQTQFYVICTNEESEDITRFSILNFLPPPIAVPTTQEQDSASSGAVNIGAAASGSQQIVASTVSGTLENASINYSFSSSSPSSMTWSLVDGLNNIIAAGAVQGNGQVSGVSFQVSDIRVRFQNGIVFKWAGSNYTSGNYMTTNLYYRTP